MRLLLDTHVYLWWLQDNPKLSKTARSQIVSAECVFVSSASIWEAAIKAGIGKLDADINALVEEIANCGFQELPVTARHAAHVTLLPDIHRDPFDRMLISQAMCEPLRLLTNDDLLSQYTELVDMI
jgi:PIN domain nuclease of toxin-antitoxin system